MTYIKPLLKAVPKKSTAPIKDAEDLFHVTDWPMHYFLAIDRFHIRNIARVLSAHRCSPLMWRVLSILADRDGHSVSELADLSVIERSNLSRILDAMERDELIERIGHETDKRQTHVFLSEQGRQLFVESLPAVLDYYARFLTGISPSEMTVLMSVLKKIKRNVASFDTRDSSDLD